MIIKKTHPNLGRELIVVKNVRGLGNGHKAIYSFKILLFCKKMIIIICII